MASGVLLVLRSERAIDAWSVMVFSLGCRVSSYTKGPIMYVSEARTKKTTMVKEFPTDGEMKVTLTRPFPARHVLLDVSSARATSNSCLLGSIFFARRPTPPTTRPSFLPQRRPFTPLFAYSFVPMHWDIIDSAYSAIFSVLIYRSAVGVRTVSLFEG